MVAHTFALSPTFIQPALLLRLWENVGPRSARGIVKKVQGLLQTLSAQRRRARLEPNERLCAELYDVCVLRVGVALGDIQDEDALQNTLDTLTKDLALETTRSALNQVVAELLMNPSPHIQQKFKASPNFLLEQAQSLSPGHKAKLSSLIKSHIRALQQLLTLGFAPSPEVEQLLESYDPESPFGAPALWLALKGAQRADLCAFALLWLYDLRDKPVEPWMERALWETLERSTKDHLALLLALGGSPALADIDVAPLDLGALVRQAHESARRLATWSQEAREHDGPVYYPLGEPAWDD